MLQYRHFYPAFGKLYIALFYIQRRNLLYKVYEAFLLWWTSNICFFHFQQVTRQPQPLWHQWVRISFIFTPYFSLCFIHDVPSLILIKSLICWLFSNRCRNVLFMYVYMIMVIIQTNKNWRWGQKYQCIYRRFVTVIVLYYVRAL